MGVDEKIRRFKELVKSGVSISKARRGSGLHSEGYKRYYDEIWSDPDMAPYRPKYGGSSGGAVEVKPNVGSGVLSSGGVGDLKDPLRILLMDPWLVECDG
jgi:hypothetical protein